MPDGARHRRPARWRVVVICGDGFEQLAIAMAARVYMNKKPVGDLSGSIDEASAAALRLDGVRFVAQREQARQ